MRSTSPKARRTSVVATALALLVCAGAVHAAQGPCDVVQRLGDEVLAVLRDTGISNDEKRTRIEQIAVRGVDFETLSKLVLARHWTRFSPDEQARFQTEFRRHLSVTYGRSVDSYKNETFTITGERDEARGDKTIKTKIVRNGGVDDIVVDYRVRQVNGEWKIIDFIVEGVSLVSNFRSQFQDLLASKDPGQLIQLLHEKNAKGESIVKDQPAQGT
jgi:phospholipid transport system substrate-binding protein